MAACLRIRWETVSRGCSRKKQDGSPIKPKVKGKGGGKAKGKRTGVTCCVYLGVGHTARLCPSEGWVNNLEEETSDGENDDGCWAEEEVETLHLRYLGSDAGAVSSPPGMHDVFSETGWIVVTRKSRDRTKLTRRYWYLDKSGTVLASLWDDDVILGQVPDDRTQKGLVKISAVVDSGEGAHALPESMMSGSRSSRAQAQSQVHLLRCRRVPRSLNGRDDGDWPNG